MLSDRRFYVYVLFRPTGSPCYVGKGCRSRWKHHEWLGNKGRNKRLARIIAKAGGELPKVKIRTGLTHSEALEIESALILAIGRGHKGPLVNMNDGGEGQIGWVPSQKTRDRIREANTGKKPSDETRAKMSAAGRGRKKSAEHRAKIGAAHKGKKLSDAQIAVLKLPKSDDAKSALKNYHANMTPEQKAARALKISIATKAAMADPSIRASIDTNRKASRK